MATDSPARAALAQVRGKPELLQVVVNGEVRRVAVPDVKRWKARAAQVLDSMEWESVQPMDAKGNILGPEVENPQASAAGDLEDLDELDSMNAPTSVAGLLGLMLKAQDTALKRQAQAYESVLDNNAKLLGVISNRLAAMEQHAHKQFQLIDNLYSKRVSDDGGNEIEGMVAGLVTQHLLNQGQTPGGGK